jgi:hypothetical protein
MVYSLDPTLLRPGGRYKAFIRGHFLVLDIDNHRASVDSIADSYRFFASWEKLPEEVPQALPSLCASSRVEGGCTEEPEQNRHRWTKLPQISGGV